MRGMGEIGELRKMREKKCSHLPHHGFVGL